jgi:hypothetical protein
MPPLSEEERAMLRGSLTTLRIIVFALIMGVTAFTGYGVYTHLQPGVVPPQRAVMPAMMRIDHALAIAAGAATAILALTVPPFIPIPKVETDKTDPRELAIVQAAGGLQMRTIIACALLEGTAFFNAFYVQKDFSLPNLAMVGVLLFLMALHFPLTGWYYGKVERLMGVDPFESSYALKRNEP